MTTAPTSQTMLFMTTPLKLDTGLIGGATCRSQSHAGEACSGTRRSVTTKPCAVAPVIGFESATRDRDLGIPVRDGRNVTFSHATGHVCTVVAKVRYHTMRSVPP